MVMVVGLIRCYLYSMYSRQLILIFIKRKDCFIFIEANSRMDFVIIYYPVMIIKDYLFELDFIWEKDACSNLWCFFSLRVIVINLEKKLINLEIRFYYGKIRRKNLRKNIFHFCTFDDIHTKSLTYTLLIYN